MAGAFFHGELGEVEAEAGFAHLRIGAVAGEAAGGEDGLDVLIEVETLAGGEMSLAGVTAGDRHKGDRSQEQGGQDMAGLATRYRRRDAPIAIRFQGGMLVEKLGHGIGEAESLLVSDAQKFGTRR
jgi:hypothetical protein